MSQISQRPQTLWRQESPTPSVRKYFDTYQGEFDTQEINSDYPYEGKASRYFRQVLGMDEYEAARRFEGKGNGCWALRSDRILNNLTADVLAAAEALGGKLATKSASGMPGGIGAEVGTVWVALLDGGVGVEVTLYEHETTNRMRAYQRTTIRGPRAYRALLELLGCHWIKRRLQGESATPSHEELTQLVNDLLAKEAS